MTDSQPPLPQPQLQPKGITSEQYFDYTPEKLELSRGFYNYGGQDFLGFQLAVLTNMGLLKAIRHVGISLWLQALEQYMWERWEAAEDEPEVMEAMMNRLNRGMDDLAAVADFLGEPLPPIELP